MEKYFVCWPIGIIITILVGLFCVVLYSEHQDSLWQESRGIKSYKQSSRGKTVRWGRDRNDKFTVWYFDGDLIYKEQ